MSQLLLSYRSILSTLEELKTHAADYTRSLQRELFKEMM